MAATLGNAMPARVVQRSEIALDTVGGHLVKLMLNVPADGQEFEAGQEIGFVPPGEAPDPEGGNLRRYSIDAVAKVPFEDTLDLTLFVRAHAGETTGVADWLRSLPVHAEISFHGPFKYPFYPPSGSRSNLVMLGAGYGVVPFRWLARKIHERGMDWMGNVLMLEGGETGLENLYLNSPGHDLDQYFDTQSFRAFEALKTRYSATTPDLASTTESNIEALVRMLNRGSVYVYLAGYRPVAEAMDRRLAEHLRLQGRWADMKEGLRESGHWREYLYG